MKTLVLGGVKSGKSRHAEQLAVASGLPVTLIATALAGDDEMSQRIEQHKQNRPKGWQVIEEPLDIAGKLGEIAGAAHATDGGSAVCVIVDCLTLWLAQSLDQLAESQSLVSLRDELLSAVSQFPGSWFSSPMRRIWGSRRWVSSAVSTVTKRGCCTRRWRVSVILWC